MNEELKALETMGLVLPSPAYLAGSLLFGIVGYIAFRRGRKTTQPVLVWTGVALLVGATVIIGYGNRLGA